VSTYPQTPNPQASAPEQGAGASAPQPQQAQANPLQTMLGRIAMILRQLGTQNTVVQPEMQEASQKVIEALQKVSQASMGSQAQPPAPPQQ